MASQWGQWSAEQLEQLFKKSRQFLNQKQVQLQVPTLCSVDQRAVVFLSKFTESYVTNSFKDVTAHTTNSSNSRGLLSGLFPEDVIYLNRWQRQNGTSSMPLPTEMTPLLSTYWVNLPSPNTVQNSRFHSSPLLLVGLFLGPRCQISLIKSANKLWEVLWQGFMESPSHWT